MPLTRLPRAPVAELHGLLFAMGNAGRTINVLVTHEALQNVSSPPLAAGTYKAQFNAHRALLEKIAGDKFDRGQLEPDGSVLIVTTDLPPAP